MKFNVQIQQYQADAVKEIKTAILQSQYAAVKLVNREQLSLYFAIGKYVSDNSRLGCWGKGSIEVISVLLQKELPGLRGFSATSIKKMRQFYEAWNTEISNSTAMAVNISSLGEVAESIKSVDAQLVIANNTTATATEFNLASFLSLSFTHHIEILNKAKDIEERIFYINQSVKYCWSKYTLREELRKDLFHHQGNLPNNFNTTIPAKSMARKAVMMFKDDYLLDFINVEEIGERDSEDIDERVVEQGIVHNIKKFIMTFGHDFAFIGNQYHLEAYSEDFFPDLLFFNRELNAMVVVELKTGKFKPSYLGQLTTYLRLLDDKVRKPHENPTIGIVLCKSANKDFVEYVIQDYDKPMGVATYSTSREMPEKLRNTLPDVEELRRLLVNNKNDEE